MQVGIAADHGGFELKVEVTQWLREAGFDVQDFGANNLNLADDYPDFVIPLARSIASGQLERGIAICGSGVGASIAANKVNGVRAALIHEEFSARQGVEDDDMNIICLGGRVIDFEIAQNLIDAFLSSRFSDLDRHKRRLAKVFEIEQT